MSSQKSDEVTISMKTAESVIEVMMEEARREVKKLTEHFAGNHEALAFVRGHAEQLDELESMFNEHKLRRKDVVTKAAMDDKLRALIEKDKAVLNVGGTRFTTSVQTLTSVPDTFFASMFSGRFDLTLDADGAYFIDRDGSHFRHILEYLRDPTGFELDPDLTTAQRRGLLKEAEFFCVTPLVTSLRQSLEHSGFEAEVHLCRHRLERACQSEDDEALKAAIAYARCIAFEMKSDSHFLYNRSRRLTFVMTNEFVNMTPVWATDVQRWDFVGHEEEGTCYLYRNDANVTVMTDVWDKNAKETTFCKTYLWNKQYDSTTHFGVPAPYLPATDWLAPEFTASSGTYKRNAGNYLRNVVTCTAGWEKVSNLSFRVIHALPDDDPTMAKALRALAKLSR